MKKLPASGLSMSKGAECGVGGGKPVMNGLKRRIFVGI